MEVPPSFKPLVPFLKHAQQLEKVDPIVSYYCRYYAVQQGIKIRQQKQPDEQQSKKFLISIMDQLEAQKKTVQVTEDAAKEHITSFALRVFQLADDEDRQGKASKMTAINFFSASQFIEILTQFGELSPDVCLECLLRCLKRFEKQKYAKWKAADINSALKKGLTPKPGGPQEQQQDEELLKELTNTTPSPATSSSSDIPSIPSFSSSSPTIPTLPSFPSYDSVQPPSSSTPSFPSNPSFPSSPSFPATPSFPTSSTPSHSLFTPSIPPSASAPFPQPQQHSYQQPSIPSYNTLPASLPSPSSTSYTPTPQDIELANKYARFVVSSLQFDDVSAAVKNAKLVLKHLTGQQQ